MKNGQFIEADGSEYWFKDDDFHRLDGPAVIYPTGSKKWYKRGKLHRLDGPAIIYSTKDVEFFINGKNIQRELDKWIYENKYPEWKNEESWDDAIKMHFKLTFAE